MKRKHFIWLLSVAFILIGGCFVFIILTIFSHDNYYAPTKDQDNYFESAMLINSAIERGDASICDKIENLFLKNKCYLDVGIAKQNYSICDQIQEKGSSKDFCYYKIGVAEQNLSICNKIDDQNYKKICICGINES